MTHSPAERSQIGPVPQGLSTDSVMDNDEQLIVAEKNPLMKRLGKKLAGIETRSATGRAATLAGIDRMLARQCRQRCAWHPAALGSDGEGAVLGGKFARRHARRSGRRARARRPAAQTSSMRFSRRVALASFMFEGARFWCEVFGCTTGSAISWTGSPIAQAGFVREGAFIVPALSGWRLIGRARDR